MRPEREFLASHNQSVFIASGVTAFFARSGNSPAPKRRVIFCHAPGIAPPAVAPGGREMAPKKSAPLTIGPIREPRVRELIAMPDIHSLAEIARRK